MPQFIEKLQQFVNESNSNSQTIALDFNKENKPSIKEALSTPDVSILMPRVIAGVLRDSAEPIYIGSKLLQVVRLTEGRSIEFPAISAMRAYDVAEGQEIPEGDLDFNTYKTTEVRIGKSGIKVRVTDEMISDSQWDVIGILLKKAGEALARHKEEKIFREFSRHGHTVFDNDITAVTHPDLTPEQIDAAHTTGLDINAVKNNTLSTEDFIDMVITLMANNMTPTDVLMHPLCWSIFAKNEYINKLQLPALGADNGVTLNPNAVGGRIPFALNMQFSPFIPFDRENRKFDMYVVDKNNIGILLVKDDIKTEQFDDPARDIQNIKIVERYGIGILNEGRGIAVAKNLKFDKSYDYPERVIQVNS
jgi:hypothetical protein